jgi:hypothetical protein
MVRTLLLALALFLTCAGTAMAQKNRPAWAELPVEQQQILAPLRADWDSLEPDRRRKWIGIAKRYPKMQAEEQARVQRRMQAWAKLTPDQRRQARENYKNIAKAAPKAAPDKRAQLREHWAEYQALPPSERQNLSPPPAQPAPKKNKKDAPEKKKGEPGK